MNLTFVWAELLRIVRNKRTVVFSVVMPMLFFFLFSSTRGDPQHSPVYAGLSVEAYYMVAMGTYAATNALFTSGGRISVERAAGWNRQLRLAGVSGPSYLTTKVAMAYVTALPGFIVVLVLATTTRGVQLPALRWLGVIAAVLITLAPVAALGVLIGYLAKPDSLQPIFGLGSALIAMAGGMFIPIGVFSSGIQDFLRLLPPYWATYAGRAALLGHGPGWQAVLVLSLWTAALGYLAARAYQRDTAK